MEASISLRLAIFDDSPAAPYSRQSLAHPYCTQGRASAAGRYASKSLGGAVRRAGIPGTETIAYSPSSPECSTV